MGSKLSYFLGEKILRYLTYLYNSEFKNIQSKNDWNYYSD